MSPPLATLIEQAGVTGTGSIYFLKTKTELSIECLRGLNAMRK